MPSLRSRLLAHDVVREANRIWTDLQVRLAKEPVKPLTLALVLLLVEASEQGAYAHDEVIELVRRALAHDLADDEMAETPREPRGPS